MDLQKVKELLLSKMSADEALTLFLESSLVNYKHLKFSDPKEETHPVVIIAMAAMDMNWGFLMLTGDEEKSVDGMAIGTNEYLKRLEESFAPKGPRAKVLRKKEGDLSFGAFQKDEIYDSALPQLFPLTSSIEEILEMNPGNDLIRDQLTEYEMVEIILAPVE